MASSSPFSHALYKSLVTNLPLERPRRNHSHHKIIIILTSELRDWRGNFYLNEKLPARSLIVFISQKTYCLAAPFVEAKDSLRLVRQAKQLSRSFLLTTSIASWWPAIAWKRNCWSFVLTSTTRTEQNFRKAEERADASSSQCTDAAVIKSRGYVYLTWRLHVTWKELCMLGHGAHSRCTLLSLVVAFFCADATHLTGPSRSLTTLSASDAERRS